MDRRLNEQLLLRSAQRLGDYYKALEPVLSRLTFHESADVPVMAIDGALNVLYNPDAVKIGAPGLYASGGGYDFQMATETFILHEALHMVLEHPKRLGENSEAKNVAADMEINTVLQASGRAVETMMLPEEAPYHFPRMLSAEQYLRMLLAGAPPEGGKGQGGEGEGEDQQGEGEEGEGKEDKRQGKGSRQSQPGGGRGEKEPSPYSKELHKRPLHKGNTLAEAEEALRQAKQQMVYKAVEDLDRMVARLVVDWKALLREYMIETEQRFGMDEYTYSTPNRRQEAYGEFVMPTLADASPRMVVMVDVSGSIDNESIEKAVRECIALNEEVLGGKPCVYATHDTGLVWHDITDNPEAIFRHVTRGGTNFGLPYDKIISLYPDVHVIVWITDGDGGISNEMYRGEAPIPIIWVLYPGCGRRGDTNGLARCGKVVSL